VIVHGQTLHLAAAIDPNTASLEDLSRIPHLGQKLAANIIAFRDARQPLTPDAIVFHHPEDLDQVPGIGKSLITQITPHLTFPDDAATQPIP
jgi:DNA uptake protein ComE-like DNA-binding protein